jgi:ketosteroid isomerase-like protein
MTLSPADRLDISDLLTRADTAASARDIEGYLSLLTSDMVLDGDQGTYRGTSALRSALAAVWATEQKPSLHLTLNPVVDPGAQPGRARARSVLLIMDPGPPPALATAARITLELRQEGGRWKISRRTVSAAGLVPEPPSDQPQEDP